MARLKLAPLVENRHPVGGNRQTIRRFDDVFGRFRLFRATCYHRHTAVADIEDVSRRTPCDAKDDEKKKSCVVVCPWHHYKIDVGLGERVYFDAFTKERKTVARDKGREVKVDDDENVYIKLNEEESYESDRYAHKQPLKAQEVVSNIGSGYNRYAGTGGA